MSLPTTQITSNSNNPDCFTPNSVRQLTVRPIPVTVARDLLIRNHYLHSLPGGTQISLGVFSRSRLAGVITFGVGPVNGHRLVEGARPRDCQTLTRLWLSDDLGRNSESRVIGLSLRALRKHTHVKFVLSYADPAQGHIGIVYQASNWIYIGLSEASPKYDFGDGISRHSRTVSHTFGSHSRLHFSENGVDVRLIPQSSKHRYVYFLDRRWRDRLVPGRLLYPKKETEIEPS